MEGVLKQRRVVVQRLTCSVQSYDWGRRGADSLVARLCELNSGARVEPDRSYAEFWMGTHVSGPSFLAKNGVENGVSNGGGGGGEDWSFKSWLLKNPDVIGDKVLNKWGCDLPFLFKTEIIMEVDGFANQKKLHRLRCSVQNYDWGQRGHESEVAKLFRLNSGSNIELEKPYAEFWMGTHDSGPSFVVQNVGENGENPVGLERESLKLWVSKTPNVLGKKVLDKWDCNLPFLFKVLSVAKALSIQAHPDKELANTLHKLQPNVYKDDNHKPEMALAITEFEALCGFISLPELKIVLQNVPEIVELVGTVDANQVLHINEQAGEEKVKSVLRSVFTQLMTASKEMTAKVVSNLKSRLHMESKVRPLTEKERLVLRLEKQYPSDIGVISAFFFNYVKLNPGEALYLGANEPHAYISGECIECMATSDNVVRAGLTPKHRDVETLCSMLTYKQGFPEILKGFPLSPYITRYLPPFDEFEVDRCILPQGASAVFPAISGPSVFLVTVGEGTMGTGTYKDAITEGDVLFAPANTEISITTSSELQLYRAGVNSRFLQAL